MATVVSMRTHRTSPTPVERTGPRPWWLVLSVPIAVLGAAGSLAGILVDRIYADETDNWAAQAVGQDVANLVVFAAMLVLGYAAAHGSLRAHLAWLGTVTYSAYTYAIYAFGIHFGPLFLLYVAVFGMSVWALVGGLANLEPRHVRAAYARTSGARFAAVFLIVVSGAFALLWLAQDLPAVISGDPSQELVDTGLLTNPVHVLDLGLFLPAAMTTGVLLLRGDAWGHVLAPAVLSTMMWIGLGIVSVTIVSAARDLDGSLVVAAVIGALALVQAAAGWVLLDGVDPGATVDQVLRRHGVAR